MRLSHNLASLNIYKNYAKSVSDQSKAVNNISLGLKVNSAKDNPNVIAQSEKIRMQIRGLQMAGRNVQDGISMVQTAEGGLNEMTSIVQRMRELAIQSGNGNCSTEDKVIIQKEIDQLASGYEDIAKNTKFNGNKLFASVKTVNIMIGANSGENVSIPFYDLTTSVDSLKSTGINNVLGNDISGALHSIDNVLDTVLSVRDKYGAIENRLESTYDNVYEIAEKMERSDSNLTDADIALEMLNYSKASILTDAGNAMMAQSNKFPQEVLNSLANVGRK
ncbi:MAG: flagellin [Solirubrobacterales bacterium]